MIKIRYRDPNELSPGLHAAAERHGRSTTVYLLPGLSAAQRRAALRRLKISARRGYDPRLPAPQLAVALAADRIRTTVGRAGAVFRLHPAGSTVPVMVVSAGAIAFLVLSAVSIRVIHTSPRAPGQAFSGAAGPAASVRAGPGPGRSAAPIAAGLGDPPGGSVTGSPGQPGSGAGPPGGPVGGPAGGPVGGPVEGRAAGGSAPASGSAIGADPGGTGNQGGTTLTGGAAPTPAPGGNPASTAPAASSSAAAPAGSATISKPSPTPAASKSGLCVNVGSLGLCV
jgi:hypothetical protein